MAGTVRRRGSGDHEYPDNPNINVLEFIDKQPGFHGKVVTFASWDAVSRILNRNRNGMLVNIYSDEWTSHGSEMAHSNETYFMAMGAGVTARGEVKGGAALYQEQYAATLAEILGLKYVAPHPVAAPLSLH